MPHRPTNRTPSTSRPATATPQPRRPGPGKSSSQSPPRSLAVREIDRPEAQAMSAGPASVCWGRRLGGHRVPVRCDRAGGVTSLTSSSASATTAFNTSRPSTKPRRSRKSWEPLPSSSRPVTNRTGSNGHPPVALTLHTLCFHARCTQAPARRWCQAALAFKLPYQSGLSISSRRT